MQKDELAKKVFQLMFDHDAFSQWLGMRCVFIAPGKCHLQMNVRKEMLNGFFIAHGGIAYALADSALAFASNSHGIKSVSIETSISHTRKIQEGDILNAVASEMHVGEKTATYEVIINNQEDQAVAFFKGTVFRTGKHWIT